MTSKAPRKAPRVELLRADRARVPSHQCHGHLLIRETAPVWHALKRKLCERYGQCFRVTMRRDELQPGPLLAIGFSLWKQDSLRRLLKRPDIHFHSGDALISDLPTALRHQLRYATVLIWGRAESPFISALLSESGSAAIRVEDGFLRSYGIGAARIPPNVLVFDRRGIYFDAHNGSDVESAILSGTTDPARLAFAEACLARWRKEALSKYVLPVRRNANLVYGPKTRPRVLVLGQVADDASILCGAPPGSELDALVRQAATENPESEIIYKIHPDVLAGVRNGGRNIEELKSIATIIAEPLPLPEAFRTIDRVYTYTSLAGFEAVLHGLPVSVFGAPFYAGWGFTDDRWLDGPHVARRNVKRSPLEVFQAAYLDQSIYFNPETGHLCEMPDAMDRIVEHRRRNHDSRKRGWLKRLRVALRYRFLGKPDRKSGLIGPLR